MKTEKKTQTFEDAMTRLEEIVGLLEDGGAPLEETTKLYTEGAKLAAFCSAKIQKAQQAIDKIDLKQVKTKEEN